VRSTDEGHCLIAVLAFRADVDVLHIDRDIDAIARHPDLRVRNG
jgi:hypothetical protein